MFINVTTRQQISVYSKLTFACLYTHIWKSGGTKQFLLDPLANHVLYPLTYRIAAPCLELTNDIQ